LGHSKTIFAANHKIRSYFEIRNHFYFTVQIEYQHPKKEIVFFYPNVCHKEAVPAMEGANGKET